MPNDFVKIWNDKYLLKALVSIEPWEVYPQMAADEGDTPEHITGHMACPPCFQVGWSYVQ